MQSLKLGRANLTFRSVNNRFDIVGGLLYYLLVVSARPPPLWPRLFQYHLPASCLPACLCLPHLQALHCRNC